MCFAMSRAASFIHVFVTCGLLWQCPCMLAQGYAARFFPFTMAAAHQLGWRQDWAGTGPNDQRTKTTKGHAGAADQWTKGPKGKMTKGHAGADQMTK